jgi:hypothetical protein
VRRGAALVCALALVAVGCAAPPAPAPNPAVEAEGRRHVYVALGDRLVAGADDTTASWPRLLLREVFPRESTLTILATQWAASGSVLEQQVPDAERLLTDAGPGTVRVATVLVGGLDLLYGASPDYVAEVSTETIRRLRAAGAAVVIALVPRLAVAGIGGRVVGTPSGSDREATQDRELAQLLTETATKNGAVLVDLGSLGQLDAVLGPDAAPTVEATRKIADLVAPAVRAAISR